MLSAILFSFFFFLTTGSVTFNNKRKSQKYYKGREKVHAKMRSQTKRLKNEDSKIQKDLK